MTTLRRLSSSCLVVFLALLCLLQSPVRVTAQDTVTGWKQLGSDLLGKAANDQSGWSIAMNAAGTRLAVGALQNAGGGVDAGHVRVYEWTNAAAGWLPMGADINGAAGTGSGQTVAMSGDGSTIAIGAYSKSPFVGTVTLYTYNSGSRQWAPLGRQLAGTTSRDRFGMAIDLNYDGSIVAIGSPYHDYTTIGEDKGRVQLFQYNNAINNVFNWNPYGDPIRGKTSAERFGQALSLNKAGDILAVGSPMKKAAVGTSTVLQDNVGSVQVYKKVNNVWQEMGQAIVGVKRNDQSGFAVAINDDGTVLAIGSPYHSKLDTYNDDTGMVRAYTYNNVNNVNRWDPKGQTLFGAGTGDWFGYAMDMNADGSVMAIGSPFHGGKGSVEIHQYVNVGNAWSIGGKATAGETLRERFGWSVAISADGKKAAGGSPFNARNGVDAGKVRAFQFNNLFQGWSVDIQSVDSKFDDSGEPEITLVFRNTQPPGTGASTYTVNVLRPRCLTLPANSDAVQPVPSATGAVSAATSSTLEIKFDVNANTLVGSPFYLAPSNGNKAKIQFCAEMKVSNGGQQRATEKVDFTLEVDMDQDLRVDNIPIDRKSEIIIVNDAAGFDYAVNTFICTDQNQRTNDQSIKVGQVFNVCVQSPAGTGVSIKDLYSVSFENAEVPLLGVDLIDEDGNPVDPQTTTLTCANGICRIRTTLPDSLVSYTDSQGNPMTAREKVYMQGSANFGFGRRLGRALDQDDSAMSARFLIQIPVEPASEEVLAVRSGLPSAVSLAGALAAALCSFLFLAW